MSDVTRRTFLGTAALSAAGIEAFAQARGQGRGGQPPAGPPVPLEGVTVEKDVVYGGDGRFPGINGFFEADLKTGKLSRLFELAPPKKNAAPSEVTYHGVQAIHDNIVLAANEGRSFLDAVDVRTGSFPGPDNVFGSLKKSS